MVCLIGLMGAACTTAHRAEVAGQTQQPTPYIERESFFDSFGYGGEAVDETTQKIWFTGNSVTSVRRATEVLRYHAGKIGEERGASHFSMGEIEVSVTCDQYSAWVHLVGNATFGDEASLQGKAYAVDEVLRGYEGRLTALNDTSPQYREKIYLAHKLSCRTKRLEDPSMMQTRNEIAAEEATRERDSE